MRERVTKIFSCLFIASSLLVALFPFYLVFADASYLPIEYNTPTVLFKNENRNVTLTLNTDNVDFRVVALNDGNDSSRRSFYAVSDVQASFSVKIGNNNPSNYTTNTLSNGYYVKNFNSPLVSYISDLIVPYTNVTGNNSNAVYYTFGDGAVDPEEPGPNWGGPANVMFNTRILGSGQIAARNIDRIVFSPNIDSNGNILPDNARVQIRAVPLEYSGLTPTDVLSKTYSQAILDYTNAAVLMDRIVANGIYEVMWSEVAEKLSIPFSTVNSVVQGDDYFYKMGWIYEIRLQIDDYYSEWVKIYTATSSGAQIEEDISNTDTISQDLIGNIIIINSLNQTETVNWYINETEINMQEYNEPGEGQKPWWAYLLEAIVNSFNITNNYINEGNDTTINISNTVNNSDDQMNNKINQYQQYEDDFIQDMDDNLTDIDTNVPLLSNSKFVNSAQWVAQQYTRMTNNTVIGSLLGFSLVFGLALIFIGRIR